MRTWGYTSGSLCIILGVMSLVMAVLLIVVAKADISVEFKSNTVGFGAFVIVMALVVMIVGGVTLWKVFLANQLYLRVNAEVAQGKLSWGAPTKVPATATTDITTAARSSPLPRRPQQRQPPSPPLLLSQTTTRPQVAATVPDDSDVEFQ